MKRFMYLRRPQREYVRRSERSTQTTDVAQVASAGVVSAAADVYAELFERVAAIMLVVDPASGEITWANQNACEFYGYSLVGINKKNIADLSTAADGAFFERLKLPGHSGVFTFALQQKKAGGAVCDVEMEWRFDNAGGRSYWIVTIKDVTADKQAQSTFLEMKAGVEALFRACPIAMNIFSLDGKYLVEVNEAFVELTGYKREELIGHGLQELSPMLNMDDFNHWMQELQENHFIRNVETLVRRKSGEVRHVIGTMGMIQVHGRGYAVSMVVDISTHKETVDTLQDAYLEMEQRVKESTAELLASNVALQQALNVKNQFFAAISHELRTPLTGIIGLSQILQMPAYGALNEKQREAVNNIHSSGQRLLKVVNDVLEYTLLQSSALQPENTICLLDGFCQGVMRRANLLASAKSQRTHLHISPQNIIISVDERRLDQLLEHLLSNASKFTREGGEFGLHISGRADEQVVAVTVWDRGIGISEEYFDRIFNPFMQVDAGLSRMYEGTGLGLALVKQLADILGGRMLLESQVGEGSRFTLLLPWDAAFQQPGNLRDPRSE